ncbi:hypothetical protein QSJ19_24105 [Gordonia sp. ABSL11-1]|uniref:hypothetical protein n=1 Tax=Gordonia sp. ABSL11-1 TaxID=3053924 RepID=UPI0025729F05|nr:hypothetical protein [Gordonia sp. ABSL11-1]MDL9948611.1 hypothetical protein [Gordonia sp. ABSL11-1]
MVGESAGRGVMSRTVSEPVPAGVSSRVLRREPVWELVGRLVDVAVTRGEYAWEAFGITRAEFDLLRHARAWAPFHGSTDADIFLEFGISRADYLQRLSTIVDAIRCTGTHGRGPCSAAGGGAGIRHMSRQRPEILSAESPQRTVQR